MMAFEDLKIAIIGLGYVGLPLAVEFGRKFPVIGFDIESARICELGQGIDRTKTVAHGALESANLLRFTSDESDLASCNCYIITVPTPIDKFNRPDLRSLKAASETVGRVLCKGDFVIFESTVYPGCTENDCIPIIEGASELKLNEDFCCGYSPERVNPGDPERSIKDIKKVTSGSNDDAADFCDRLYQEIIEAGTHKAESIQVAEAAKVIENTQRDLNIALVNELAIIFNRLGIDSEAVFRAAETKWNFLPFRPGLVGGHCISVDPYYLTHKAQEVGHHPEIILAGRRVNDGMGKYVASQLVKTLTAKKIKANNAKVLILGFTFKENCGDVRNTRVADIVDELGEYGCDVSIFDPWADAEEVSKEYGFTLINAPVDSQYDAILIAVAHDCFKEMGEGKVRRLCKSKAVIYDLKYVLPTGDVDLRL
tara:strand:- start:497 stop:1774 length:1278 start_codon:yes stop_codon:yes gene_type:complete